MLETITRSDKWISKEIPGSIPNSMDLAMCFEKFVKYWGQNPELEYLGPTNDVTLDMPVEISVRWKSSVGGTIVIRCFPEFLDWLMESREYKPLFLSTPKEIFYEMCALYCVHLIKNFWVDEISEMGLVLPKPSTSTDWPVREPDSTCSLLVGQAPLEIRLWMD
jgi:hypothetical protein